jgi:preprotein translocase subunit SecA
VADHLAGDTPDDWGMEALAAALKAMGLEGEGTSEDELWDIGSRDEILEHLLELADARLDARAAEIGEADWSLVERHVLLRTIDSLWVEHLTEIDDMRRGIGLRGYAQQDPLNEFRREAFELYGELRDLIRHQVASTIFRVSVTRTPPPEQGALEQNLAAGAQRLLAAAGARGGRATSGASSATSADGGRPAGPRPVGPVVGGGLPRDPMASARVESAGNGRGVPAGQAKPGFTPAGARIGRNDPCWCGSGQKYKKCHGR